MCGISGFFDSTLSTYQAGATASKMLDSISHRGRDNSAFFTDLPMTLAHNRLAIIDLTPEADQPMEDMNTVIVLNGEIYNYLELKDILQEKGYRFATRSDTEVVIAAYHEWGEHCVDHFVGMWAFAIWDRRTRCLFCSRDRFGIKPFYYIFRDNKLYFASEYKALKLTPLFSNEINEKQVIRGLQLGWLFYEEETYFTCIKRLPAASNLTFDGTDFTISRYWNLDLTKKSELSFEEKRKEFRRLFFDSIKLHLRSDVRIGTCLSGGIDSSSVVSAISALFPEQPIDTFTIYYDGDNEVDERPWVYEVAARYPNIHPHYYMPKEYEILDAFKETQFFADVPLASSSPVSQYLLMKMASAEGVKVLLDGQGADEFLAGYLHSFDRLIGEMFHDFQWIDAFRMLLDHKFIHRQPFSTLGYQLMKSILASVKDEQEMYFLAFKHKQKQITKNLHVKPPFEILSHPAAKRFDEFLHGLVFTTSLPTLLHYEDRNSMAFSIESRVPFLDHRLVEFAFTLSNEDKIHRGVTKYILREAMNGSLPSAIYNRHDKKGFITPGEDKWLRGPLKGLLDINLGRLDFINQKVVKQVVERYKAGGNNSTLVWRLATLNHWLKNI
ncbi:MAG: asparagine synthase (glutamine-hydrolyzing) [Bacteroidetes bacterium]|nr:MAG: asparagine synthase (glutamine-hydrolyzing) [Bacteroidota bacterium]